MTRCVYQFEIAVTGRPGWVGCANHDDLVHDGYVPPDFCAKRCPYRMSPADKGAGDKLAKVLEFVGITKKRVATLTGSEDCGCADRQARMNSRPEVVDGWFVAVTTSPRPRPTVARCVESLWQCGWSPVLFAEPHAHIPDGYRSIRNRQRLGVWRNFIASVRYALATDADWILTVQDDALLHPDSKSLLEELDWPADAAFVSLYAPAKYAKHKYHGLHRVETSSLWGTCALAWRREMLEKLLQSDLIDSWAGAGPGRKDGEPRADFLKRRNEVLEHNRQNPENIQNADTAVGKICNAARRPMYWLFPSPARHISEFSTIGHGGNSAAGNRNCAPCADHSTPLKEQVFPTPVVLDMTKPQIVMIVPDVSHWRDRSKTSLFRTVLEEAGYGVHVNYGPGHQVPDCHLVINHAFALPIQEVKQLAENNPDRIIVQMNHSALGHISHREWRVARLTESVHAARAHRNIVIGCQGTSVLGMMGADAAIHLPTPGYTLPRRPEHTPQRRVFLTGRADPIKNHHAQLLAAIAAGCAVHICAEDDRGLRHVRNAFPSAEVHWHGWQEHADYVQLLSSTCDILLHASYDESFCYAACEAMQMGIPVIGSPSIRFADPATTVQPHASEEIPRTIERILANYGDFADRAATLGARAVADVSDAYLRKVASLLRGEIPLG